MNAESPTSDSAACCERASLRSGTACGLTVLRARGRRLCKAFLPDGTLRDYDQAKRFDLHAQPVADLADLEGLLDRLMHRPHCAVVRGVPVDLGRTRDVRRSLHGDREAGDPPALREEPRRWVALDVDGAPLPTDLATNDLAGCAAAVLPLLPTAFQGAAHLVQATASQGIKPGARLRLWFWLDRPLTGAECRRWLVDVPVDRSVFAANQPIYTAAPLFPAGAPDHLPRRLLRVPGAPEVATPPPADFALRARPDVPHRPMPMAQAGLYALVALARAAVRVACAPEGQRHATRWPKRVRSPASCEWDFSPKRT